MLLLLVVCFCVFVRMLLSISPVGLVCARKVPRSACTDAGTFHRGSTMYTSRLYWDSHACMALHVLTHAPQVLRMTGLTPVAYIWCGLLGGGIYCFSPRGERDESMGAAEAEETARAWPGPGHSLASY